MNQEKHWLAVYTRPRWEKKVVRLLENKKVENYCPMNKVVKQWADRKKIVIQPLISSYVFVRASEEEYNRIKETDGVLNLVYWLGRPAVIRAEEIESIKHFLVHYSNVSIEKMDVHVNDEVKIIHGPLVSREGKVVDVLYNYVKILLPTLGYSLVAHVHKSHIEKVSLASPFYYNKNKQGSLLNA